MADFCKYEESAKQDFPKCVRNIMENAAGNTVGSMNGIFAFRFLQIA